MIRQLRPFAVLILLTFSGMFTTAHAQAEAVRQRADSAFKSKDFAAAAKLYEMIVKDSPRDPAAWHRLGTAQYSLKRFPEAAVAFEHAASTGGGQYAQYNEASSWARAHETEKAFGVLEQMSQFGFTQVKLLQSDDDFAEMRTSPRFAAVVETMQRNATPCVYDPKARQLDFWVGEWDVSGPQGPAGTSSVQLILGQCVVFENWTGRFGDNGKSFNVYDATKGEWTQHWVSDRMQGVNVYTEGVYEDGKLEYRHSEFIGPDGEPHLRRLTFFNVDKDHVRQFSEVSTDRGATWSTEYDFMYTRKGN